MATLKNKSMEKEIPEAYYIIFQVWWRQLWPPEELDQCLLIMGLLIEAAGWIMKCVGYILLRFTQMF